MASIESSSRISEKKERHRNFFRANIAASFSSAESGARPGEHRGACGCEKNTGDGAGILMQVPHRFLLEECERVGIRLGEAGRYGTGLVFLPRDPKDRGRCEQIWAGLAEQEGMRLLGWRDVPTDNSSLGPVAAEGGPDADAVRQGDRRRPVPRLHESSVLLENAMRLWEPDRTVPERHEVRQARGRATTSRRARAAAVARIRSVREQTCGLGSEAPASTGTAAPMAGRRVAGRSPSRERPLAGWDGRGSRPGA
jgi:hypothetical protein